MAVTSMSRNSIGFGQEKSNRVSGKDNNLEWCQITTTPTGSFSDAQGVWNYWIFKSNGTLTVGRSGRVEYLVVAGGGTGVGSNERDNVGGGGAGGVIESAEYARIDAGSYAVTIGSGGAATTSVDTQGNDGNNSSIGSLAIAVGGGGGGIRLTAGNSGGCGGGGGDAYLGANPYTSQGGEPEFGQGFRGGNGSQSPGAGAGGGAGGSGTNGNASASSIVGGVGRTTTIITTAIATAESVGEVDSGTLYFGGGGGAGASSAGGLGGGGDSSPVNQRGVDCPANTGGGSGNADVNEGSPYAGAGGSGVVIVRTRV